MLDSLFKSSVQVKLAAVVCPPAADYAPCNCTEFLPNKPGTIYLGCWGNQLNDSQVSDILDVFLKTPGVSPVGRSDLQFIQQLTRVPSQIKSFPQLNWVDLSTNGITSIESGAFNFTDAANPLKMLYLQYNQMTTIAPGAFKGQQQNQSINYFASLIQLTATN